MPSLPVKPSLITAIVDTNVSLDLVAFFNFVPLYDYGANGVNGANGPERLTELEITAINHSGMTRRQEVETENSNNTTSSSDDVEEDDTNVSLEPDTVVEDDKTFFKNSVTVPLRHRVTGKEWVVKINNSGFHICGAKEQEEALLICDQILQLMVATSNCLVGGDKYFHKITLPFSPVRLFDTQDARDRFHRKFEQRMLEILPSQNSTLEDHEKREILTYVKESRQSGVFIPNVIEDIHIEVCKLVMINYVYKSIVGGNQTTMSRLEFSRHILRHLPDFQTFRDGRYAIKIKFDYLCNAVHHGGSISIKLRNKETDKSQTIIVHVIKGSVVHSISSMDDLEAGLEFLHGYFPMITQRLVPWN